MPKQGSFLKAKKAEREELDQKIARAEQTAKRQVEKA